MIKEIFLSIILKAESGVESIVLGLISAVVIVIFASVSSSIKKARAKKKDAEKMK